MRLRRGFTLIESGAVVFIVALLATGVILSIQRTSSGRIERGFEDELIRLAREARVRAIESGGLIRLAYSESERRFELRETTSDQESRVSLDVTLPSTLSASRFELEGDPASSADWSIAFYSDGTCDDGAVEFAGDRGYQVSISFDGEFGRASKVDGELPSHDGERWVAGEIERRVGP